MRIKVLEKYLYRMQILKYKEDNNTKLKDINIKLNPLQKYYAI